MASTLLGSRRTAARGGAVALLASAVASAALLLPATPAQAAVTNQTLVGSAAGTKVTLLNGTVSSGATAPSGLTTPYTGKTSSNSTASVVVPGLLTTGVVSSKVATTAITGGKRITSTASVAGVDLLNGLVKATAVQSTSRVSVVNGIATPSSTPNFLGLAVAGTTLPLSIPKNFTVDVPGVAKVVLNKSVATQLSDNAARQVSAGIEVTLLSAVGAYGAGTVIDVAPTAAAATLPTTQLGAAVGGLGYSTRVAAVVDGVLKVTSGPTAAQAMPAGGTAGKNVTNSTVGVHLSTILNTGTLANTVNGSRTASYSRSTVTSNVTAVNLLGGLVRADAVKAVAQSSKKSGYPAVKTGQSTLVNLVIGGKAIPVDVAPNTTVSVLGLVTVTVNQQIRTTTGITVNALDVKVVGAGLGLPVGSHITVASADAWVGTAG
ncbi:choice-of-anchor P family protein [Nocardioides jiangxiensis]|uniref:Choice-of-anchor P family protein n=1 Tax=Nocardioides jiangxiensis TaxID=3064524 RepID=A0ABT9B2B1_9ACTN|nr:choice-of-anchor P family protein [Nocardioides sp. WY-20]MDO7868985.1 choice-of-anchor P family protein [Nocardioides sp. WY-20]